MMIRRETWDQLHGFDEEFFLYAEDIDLCKRAVDQGRHLAIINSVTIFHDLGSGQYFAPQRLMFQMRGNAHYFRKHFSNPYVWLCLTIFWVSAMMRFVVGGVLGLRLEKYREMSRGFRDIALKPWLWWSGYRQDG
jgi:GT2 family glycosyltransferase